MVPISAKMVPISGTESEWSTMTNWPLLRCLFRCKEASARLFGRWSPITLFFRDKMLRTLRKGRDSTGKQNG
jgi:hypothetical protein